MLKYLAELNYLLTHVGVERLPGQQVKLFNSSIIKTKQPTQDLSDRPLKSFFYLCNILEVAFLVKNS